MIWVIWGPDEALELRHYLSLLSPGDLPLQGQEFLVAVDSINTQASAFHRKDVQHTGKHLLLFLTLQNQRRFHGIVLLHCWIPVKFRNFTKTSDAMISSCDGQGWSYAEKQSRCGLFRMVVGAHPTTNSPPPLPMITSTLSLSYISLGSACSFQESSWQILLWILHEAVTS